MNWPILALLGAENKVALFFGFVGLAAGLFARMLGIGRDARTGAAPGATEAASSD